MLSLTHLPLGPHICISKLTILDSDNGLSPGQRQAIIWTNAGILLIEFLGTYFSEILIEIHTISFMKMHLKMSSAKRRPFCPGEDELKLYTMAADAGAVCCQRFSSALFWQCCWLNLGAVSALCLLDVIKDREMYCFFTCRWIYNVKVFFSIVLTMLLVELGGSFSFMCVGLYKR